MYVSCYLDRLLSIDENAYNFNAKFYFYLSWIDKDAPAKQAEATKDAIAKGGECARLCNGQRGFGTTNKCCTAVWTPKLILRNVKGARTVVAVAMVAAVAAAVVRARSLRRSRSRGEAARASRRR